MASPRRDRRPSPRLLAIPRAPGSRCPRYGYVARTAAVTSFALVSMWLLLVSSSSVLHSATTRAPPAGAPSALASLRLGQEVSGYRFEGQPFVARRLSERPHAFLLKNFLSPEECDGLIESAQRTGLHAAVTSGGTDARRRCEVCVLSPREQQLVATIQRDAAGLLLSDEARGSPGGGVEDLHVLVRALPSWRALSPPIHVSPRRAHTFSSEAASALSHSATHPAESTLLTMIQRVSRACSRFCTT